MKMAEKINAKKGAINILKKNLKEKELMHNKLLDLLSEMLSHKVADNDNNYINRNLGKINHSNSDLQLLIF